MEITGKTDEEIIQEECQQIASKKIKRSLERILGTAYNFLPVGLMPASSYDKIKKKHRYFRPLLANITSMAYEAVLGTYLIFQNSFSYVQNFNYNGLFGNTFSAPLFSIYIPQAVFTVAGAYLLLDLNRSFSIASKFPMGTWAVETYGLIKNWVKMKILGRNGAYMKEAMQNVENRLEVNKTINEELYLDSGRKVLENLQDRMYYCNDGAEKEGLKARVNEVRKKLGMDQL